MTTIRSPLTWGYNCEPIDEARPIRRVMVTRPAAEGCSGEDCGVMVLMETGEVAPVRPYPAFHLGGPDVLCSACASKPEHGDGWEQLQRIGLHPPEPPSTSRTRPADHHEPGRRRREACDLVWSYGHVHPVRTRFRSVLWQQGGGPTDTAQLAGHPRRRHGHPLDVLACEAHAK